MSDRFIITLFVFISKSQGIFRGPYDELWNFHQFSAKSLVSVLVTVFKRFSLLTAICIYLKDVTKYYEYPYLAYRLDMDYKALADPGGRPRRATPPNRIHFFHFHICFHQKVYTSEVGAPPTGQRPPNGKSWIRHCAV